jgi:hypothetical protein
VQNLIDGKPVELNDFKYKPLNGYSGCIPLDLPETIPEFSPGFLRSSSKITLSYPEAEGQFN